MATVTCTECEKTTEVPFDPTPGKPVYCNDCFKKKRAERPAGGRGGPGGRRHEPTVRQKFTRDDYPAFANLK